MPRPPVDWLRYSTSNCFKDEDYIHDTQVMRLHIAARDNNTNSVKKSLEKGVCVYLPDAVGRSALHWAVVFCKLDTVEAVIKLFPVSRLDMGDRNGCTPLHYAVLAGRADVATMLLKAGCHVHSIDNQGRTPLHYAAQNANASVVSLLLKRRADPSYLDKMKRSPYDVAKAYNNTDKIIDCLRLETSNTRPEPEKPKPIEPRHKQPSMKSKAVETDGKVSITFYSVTNMEAQQHQQKWQSYVPEIEEEEFMIDTPVEIVKEEMERDAERMKYKLRKIAMRKEPPSEEKLKEQERALQQLLDRSKKNAMEERRKRWAEEERLRRLTRNRIRSGTQKTCSMPPSSLGMRTPTESRMGPFQTSRRPSTASSPKCETEGLTQDEWREETWTPGKVQLVETHPQTPPAELQTQINTVEKSTERQAAEHAAQTADAAMSDHQEAANVQQEHTDPAKEQEVATAPPSYFPAYVHQWFANAFPYPAVPDVSSLRDKFIQANVPEISVGTLLASPSPPPQNEEHTNLMESSSPPPTLLNNKHFTAPLDIRGQINLLSPTSALSTSSNKSPTSPQWDTSTPPSPPTMSVGTKNSTAPSTLYKKMEEDVRHTDASAPDDGQKETDVRPGYRDEHTSIKHTDWASHAKKASKNQNILGGTRSLPGRERSIPQCKLSHKIVSSESNDPKDDNSFAPLGYAHFFKLQKSLVDIPRNRHGLECFSRPKARKNNVRTSTDHKWPYNHIPPKQPWSPDEPWRPGGISKTVVDFKMYGLLKAQRKKNSVPSIRSLYHMTTSNTDEEDLDSDPFANVNPQDDDGIDRLPLAKLLRPQEALWSLREASQSSPGKSNRQWPPNSERRPTQLKLKGNNPSSDCIPQSYPTAEVASKPQANSNTTSGTEQGQGICIAQTIDIHPPQSRPDQPFRQRQLDSFSQTDSSQLTQTMSTPPQSSSQPLQTGLQYASFLQQDNQRVHRSPSSLHPQREYSPGLQSNQQQQVFPNSTSFQLPHANCSYPPNSWMQPHTMLPYHQCQKTGTIPYPQIPSNRKNPQMPATWPQQNSERMLECKSEPKSYRQDELENGELIKTSSEEYEIGSSQHRDSVVRSRSQKSVKGPRCSLEITSPARLALMEYYGQSVRPQFLGIGREQAPVHQCIDIESLIKQWR